MSKIAVVYWSGTGNTESMAAMVAAGAKEAGAEAVLLTAAEFGPDQMDGYDAIAFGCPSMGAEQLEESEFEPMFSACEAKLPGRRRMDAHLGGDLPGRWRQLGQRRGHLQRGPR